MLVAAQIPPHHLHTAIPMPMHDSSKTRQWQTHAPSSPAASSLSYSSYASTASSSSFSHSVVTKTLDEALDLEALALSAGSDYEDTCRSGYSSSSSSSSGGCGGAVPGSGLPLVCNNCGVSFFSLQITDDELECYCSGECKWSVIMYREMDRRMHALRRHVRAATARGTATRKSSATAVSATRSSVTTTATTTTTTTGTASNESYPRFMDDVISCR